MMLSKSISFIFIDYFIFLESKNSKKSFLNQAKKDR